MLYIIIPTLNAAHKLPDLFDQMKSWPARVIISDGGSEDDTLSLATTGKARIVCGSKGRGQQLARGEAYSGATKDDWLFFVHADSRLSNIAWPHMVRHMAQHPDKAGYFRFAIYARGFWPRVIEAGVGLRCKAVALPYGDQGLLIRKDLYDAVGGFAPVPLFEDVMIIRALGRARLRRLPVPIFTDPAKYKRDGYLRRSLSNLALLLRFLFGKASAEELAEKYR